LPVSFAAVNSVGEFLSLRSSPCLSFAVARSHEHALQIAAARGLTADAAEGGGDGGTLSEKGKRRRTPKFAEERGKYLIRSGEVHH